MSQEALASVESSSAGIERRLSSPEGRARLFADLKARTKEDPAFLSKAGEMRDLITAYVAALNTGTDASSIQERLSALWGNTAPESHEVDVVQVEVQRQPEAANENVIGGRVRRGLFEAEASVSEPAVSTPVPEVSAEIVSPSINADTVSESVEPLVDVEALRQEVEYINEQIGDCNPVALVTCEEYKRPYLELYHEIQRRFFSEGALSPEEAAAFKTSVKLLKDARDEVLEKTGRGSVPESTMAASVIESSIEKVEEHETEPVPPEVSTAAEEPIEEKKEEVVTMAPPEPIVEHDPLMDKEVTGALNDMLEQWLEGSGFLGFMGPTGLKHPEFQLLKNCLMSNLMEGDFSAEVRKEVRTKKLEDIKPFIQQWSTTYRVYPDNNETFEHYLRRVASAHLGRTHV